MVHNVKHKMALRFTQKCISESDMQKKLKKGQTCDRGILAVYKVVRKLVSASKRSSHVQS